MSKAITLSTHIAGRGADFVVQPEMNRRGGLHVLIAFEPPLSSSPGCRDSRMEKQMIGRTARMHRNGSYSIITTTHLATEARQEIRVEPKQEEEHHLGLAVTRVLLSQTSYNIGLWKRWIVFEFLLDKMDVLPAHLDRVVARRGSAKGSERRTSRDEKVEIILRQVLRIRPTTSSAGCCVIS
eukprot:m.111622 g.111622  ORF g.111622 m.111622 type:complete len:182 (+) comp51827_c1_seq4:1511-2056(+)